MRACDAEGALSFLLRPEFRVEMDEETGWLTLSSKQLTYRVKGVEPKWPEAVRRCRQFADGCARLNALRPGNLPPFPRIEVNKAVAQKGWIPTEVERSIQLGKGLSSGKHLARSRHSVIWQLSNKDRERIAEADRHQANFRAVSLDEYQRLTAAPARDGASQP
jgi:hypothetical protein